MPKRRVWLPSPALLVFVGVVVLVVVIAIPVLLSSQRASNARNASASLKTIASAEADFRANDRDGNKVEDFWTGDVSGLYYVRNADTKLEVKRIEQDAAD